MKSIKKVTAVICATVCTAIPFLFAACGGKDDGQSGNKEPSIKGEQVTEQQWREAINNTKSLNSVTVKHDWTRGYIDTEDGTDMGCSSNTIQIDFQNQMSFSQGTLTNTVKYQNIINTSTTVSCSNIFFEENEILWKGTFYDDKISDGDQYTQYFEDYFRNVLFEMLLYIDTKEYLKEKLTDEELNNSSYDGVELYSIIDLYNNFIYNPKTSEYKATLYQYHDYSYEVEQTSATVTIIIKDGYIAKMTYYQLWSEKTYDESFVLSDYNSTSVAIPQEKIAEIKRYFEQKTI